MMKFFYSFGASTNFQKYRLSLTSKTLDAPNDSEMNDIMKSFNGEDQETKSQIAYASILSKIDSSKSNKSWIYLLKNLFILDRQISNLFRVVQENIFVEEVSITSLPTIEHFQEADAKYQSLPTQKMLKLYWKIIKQKSRVLSSHKHIFCLKRSLRNEFLSQLNAKQILDQIQSIQRFFANSFQLIELVSDDSEVKKINSALSKIRQQFNNSKIIEYLLLQMMQKLMLYYACQLQCNNKFIQLMGNPTNFNLISTASIQKFKKIILKFRTNSSNYIKFIQKHKLKKGFEEINYVQLNPFQNEDIIGLINEYLKQKQSEESKIPIQKLVLNNQMDLKVEVKPFSGVSEHLAPRMKLSSSYKESSPRQNPFTNYISSFSNTFPPNQVMTVDLILELKRQETNQNKEELIYNLNKQPCMFQNRGSILSEKDFETNQFSAQQIQKEQCVPDLQRKIRQNFNERQQQNINFQNIYSPLIQFWNEN